MTTSHRHKLEAVVTQYDARQLDNVDLLLRIENARSLAAIADALTHIARHGMSTHSTVTIPDPS